MQSEIAPCPAPAIIAADPAEAQLTTEVSDLWKSHHQAQGAARKTREELKVIRTNLAARLHELKGILCRPGRGGAWSSFLDAHAIPRSTGDRLVRAHEKSVDAVEGNCATEQLAEPTDVIIRRYVAGWWPKLRKVLTTPEAVDIFIAALQAAAENSFGAAASESFSPSPADGALLSGVTL
jgi:hypothetical protein